MQSKKVLIFSRVPIVGYGGDMMKKPFFSLGILFALLFCGMLIKWTVVELFYAEPTIMQTSVSPDGKYTAYVFESNGGATTGWTYHISILQTGKNFLREMVIFI